MGCENPPVEDATTTTNTASTKKTAPWSTTLAVPIKEPIMEEPSAPLTTCCAGNSCEQVMLDLSSPVIPPIQIYENRSIKIEVLNCRVSKKHEVLWFALF